MKKKKRIPRFETEAQEREFWRTHDSFDYLDWSGAESVVLPNLKPSTRSISLRLPLSMIEGLKLLANKKDIPYQSLLKVYLAERLKEELENSPAHSLGNCWRYADRCAYAPRTRNES